MADQNPMGGGRSVPLELPTRHISILKRTLGDSLEGVRGDLERPEAMLDPERARREAEAYWRLLTGLNSGRIVVPDEDAREAVAAIAVASDRENEYEAVVAEHDALHGLLGYLTVTVGTGR
jgi:hypothetical protein